MSPERFNEISQMTVAQFCDLNMTEQVEYMQQKDRGGSESTTSVELQRASQTLDKKDSR